MKWLVEDLQRFPKKQDPMVFDLFNLYTVLKEQGLVHFRYGKETYEVRAVIEDGECVICFDGKWFRTVDDFFTKAKIKGQLLTSIYQDIYGWEVLPP